MVAEKAIDQAADSHDTWMWDIFL